MNELWPGSFVEESNLKQNIFLLRKALGDTPDDKRYIVTLLGKGYRFAGEVRTITQDGEDVIIGSHSRSDMVVNHTDAPPVITVPSPASVVEKVRKLNWKSALAVAACVAIGGTCWILYLRRHQPAVLGEKDSVVLADFSNSTGDPVFDETLRQGLAVQLEQSPYLKVISDDKLRSTLKQMGR